MIAIPPPYENCYSIFLVLKNQAIFLSIHPGHIKEELGKTARGAAESLSEKGSKIGKTGAFQTISQTAEAVKKELDNTSIHATVYSAPKKLRKRVEAAADSKVYQPNEDATGVELHKDSR